MSADQVRTINNQLSTLLKNKDYSNPDIKKHIRTLKIMIYRVPNLHTQPIDLLIEARTFAELNLFWCLVSRQSKDFQLAIDNVRFFYENSLSLPKSSNHEVIKSIHLLSLLSANRNEDFYSKLQNLQMEELQNNLVGFVLKLNDAIEEGNYRRVFKLKQESPLEYFAPFLQKIEDTIRIQIAKSAQKAYSVLSVKEALTIFQMKDKQQLESFSQNYNKDIEEPTIEWIFEGNQIHFKRLNIQNIKFNSEDLIKTSLMYAEELQKIA